MRRAQVVDTVKMISLVANLGDIRTLIAHPASMMHSQLSEEDQIKAGEYCSLPMCDCLVRCLTPVSQVQHQT